MVRRKGILIFSGFFILLCLVLLVAGTIPYFLFYIFILTFLIPYIHGRLCIKGIKGNVIAPDASYHIGEDIEVKYKVINKGLLDIPYLEVESLISKQLTGIVPSKNILSLKRSKTFTKSENITLRRRGFYSLGDIKVTTKDILGIYSFSRNISGDVSILVYPDIISLSAFTISSSYESGEAKIDRKFQDKSRISSLREYMEGDSVKSIHWNMTAKRDLPIVKDYEFRGDSSAYIFLDGEALNYNMDEDRRLEDKAVDAALSIVDYCLRHSMEIRMITQKKEDCISIEGQYSQDIRPFLELLARFSPNGKMNTTDLIIRNAETAKTGSTLVIITPCLDKRMGSCALTLKMKNLNPLIISITDDMNGRGILDKSVVKRLHQEGISTYHLDYAASVKEVLEVYHE